MIKNQTKNVAYIVLWLRAFTISDIKLNIPFCVCISTVANELECHRQPNNTEWALINKMHSTLTNAPKRELSVLQKRSEMNRGFFCCWLFHSYIPWCVIVQLMNILCKCDAMWFMMYDFNWYSLDSVVMHILNIDVIYCSIGQFDFCLF